MMIDWHNKHKWDMPTSYWPDADWYTQSWSDWYYLVLARSLPI